jgi:NagD protein
MIGYLIDMDGVIYRGGHLISGADAFIHQLREDEVPFRFLTNNSQRTRRDVATRLRRLGIEVEDEHIYTCAMATARFLAQQKPDGTAYVIGEGGLLTALHENGYAIVDRDPDYVVVGEGRTISFEMVEAALRMIMGGAKLIATNLDPNCPTEAGLRPGCGSTVAMLEVAGGVKAFSVGKPSPVMLRGARKELGLTTDQTVVIGDTMETDILAASNSDSRRSWSSAAGRGGRTWIAMPTGLIGWWTRSPTSTPSTCSRSSGEPGCRPEGPATTGSSSSPPRRRPPEPEPGRGPGRGPPAKHPTPSILPPAVRNGYPRDSMRLSPRIGPSVIRPRMDLPGERCYRR